jgi:hypothetical protein
MTTDAPQSRPALVSLVLMGVLLLAVAGAWLMVRFYHSPSRVGADILQDMRKQGLPALWPARRFAVRFQQKDPSGKLQRRVSMVRQPAEGSFAGHAYTEAVSGPPRRVGNIEEAWIVTNDLSEANYVAVYRTFWVKIELNKDQLSVEGSGMDRVTEDTPANYIPEGLEDLAIRQAARGGKKASFQMISDEQSFESKSIAFIRMVVTPVSRQEARCRLEGSGGSLEMTYHLDAAGEVERIQYEDGATLTPLPMGKSTRPESAPAQPEESPDEADQAEPAMTTE